MRFQVIERHRRWRSVDNHLDARHCPICCATVHGPRGQSMHLQWHIELGARLDRLPEPDENSTRQPWTAAVDDDQEQQQEGQESA